MAFSIKTQSKIAEQWQNFINDANNYFSIIKEIANQPEITNANKEKIKMMLQILLTEYKLLPSSLLIPKSIKENAKEKYIKAKELYEQLFEK